MRLYNYLKVSNVGDDSAIFRSMGIKLVEEDTGNSKIIEKLLDQNLLDEDIMILLDNANKYLKRMYRGKMKFDLCTEEQGINPDDLKLDERKIRAIKDKWFKFNDELSNIQSKFENNLKKSLHNS